MSIANGKEALEKTVCLNKRRRRAKANKNSCLIYDDSCKEAVNILNIAVLDAIKDILSGKKFANLTKIGEIYSEKYQEILGSFLEVMPEVDLFCTNTANSKNEKKLNAKENEDQNEICGICNQKNSIKRPNLGEMSDNKIESSFKTNEIPDSCNKCNCNPNVDEKDIHIENSIDINNIALTNAVTNLHSTDKTSKLAVSLYSGALSHGKDIPSHCNIADKSKKAMKIQSLKNFVPKSDPRSNSDHFMSSFEQPKIISYSQNSSNSSNNKTYQNKPNILCFSPESLQSKEKLYSPSASSFSVENDDFKKLNQLSDICAQRTINRDVKSKAKSNSKDLNPIKRFRSVSVSKKCKINCVPAILLSKVEKNVIFLNRAFSYWPYCRTVPTKSKLKPVNLFMESYTALCSIYNINPLVKKEDLIMYLLEKEAERIDEETPVAFNFIKIPPCLKKRRFCLDAPRREDIGNFNRELLQKYTRYIDPMTQNLLTINPYFCTSIKNIGEDIVIFSDYVTVISHAGLNRKELGQFLLVLQSQADQVLLSIFQEKEKFFYRLTSFEIEACYERKTDFINILELNTFSLYTIKFDCVNAARTANEMFFVRCCPSFRIEPLFDLGFY